MSDVDRKERIRAYKEAPRPAGVYVIRNLTTGAGLLGTARDLPGKLNGQRFQLEMGSHPDRELQADWTAHGPDAFEFGVLDSLEPKEQSADELAEDLRLLKDMWADRLEADGVTLYRASRRG
jgi:hypothetical protein